MALEESAIAVDSLANSINPSVTSLSTSIINLDRQLDHAVPSPSSDPPSSTKLNALAPAFVPRTSLAPPAATATAFHPVRNHFGYTPQLSVQYPSPFYGGVAQEIAADLDHATQKIVNQVSAK